MTPSAKPAPRQLVTDRLLLRPYRRSDVPALTELIGAREIADMTLRIPHPYRLQDARDLLRQIENDSNLARFGIFKLGSNQLCGGIGLNLEIAHDRAELGYWVGVPFWGMGYCTEAAGAILKYGFENLGFHRVYASCFPSNAASRRVLEKLGFKYEGRLRQHVRKWNEYRDLDCFGLLSADWRSDHA